MRRKGSIDNEILKEVEKIFKDKRRLNEWLVFLRDTEPEFYQWIKIHTYRLVNEMFGKIAFFGIQQSQSVARSFLIAFISGFVIKYQLDSCLLYTSPSPRD